MRLAMLKAERSSMASGAQTRTMPGCDGLFAVWSVYGCVYKTSGTVLKVVSVELFTFLPAWIGQFFIVIQ
jgi:hypothetical protein